MTAKLVGDPWSAMDWEQIRFWAEISGVKYLCGITLVALEDDYPSEQEPDIALDVFDENKEDILRRAEALLPSNPKPVEGEPTVIIKSQKRLP